MTDPAPEPCDTCTTGLVYLHCYDGLRRCKRCTLELAATFKRPPRAQQTHP